MTRELKVGDVLRIKPTCDAGTGKYHLCEPVVFRNVGNDSDIWWVRPFDGTRDFPVWSKDLERLDDA